MRSAIRRFELVVVAAVVASCGGTDLRPASYRHGDTCRMLGKTTKDISANEYMWRFFAAHPAPVGGSR